MSNPDNKKPEQSIDIQDISAQNHGQVNVAGGNVQQTTFHIEHAHLDPANPYLQFTGAYRLSAIETRRKNYKKADELLQLAEACAEELKGQRRLRGVKHRRALFYIAQGEYALAEPCLEGALQIDNALGEPRYQAVDYFHLAEIYQGMERLAEAREAALKAELFMKSCRLRVGALIWMNLYVRSLNQIRINRSVFYAE